MAFKSLVLASDFYVTQLLVDKCFAQLFAQFSIVLNQKSFILRTRLFTWSAISFLYWEKLQFNINVVLTP